MFLCLKFLSTLCAVQDNACSNQWWISWRRFQTIGHQLIPSAIPTLENPGISITRRPQVVSENGYSFLERLNLIFTTSRRQSDVPRITHYHLKQSWRMTGSTHPQEGQGSKWAVVPIFLPSFMPEFGWRIDKSHRKPLKNPVSGQRLEAGTSRISTSA